MLLNTTLPKIETVELAFEEFGKPKGIPIVILHGFFASSRNWRRIAEMLAENHHILVPDQRNHGNSPHHPRMDYPSMAADLLSFIEKRGFDKVHLLGHSMGGKTAMWLGLNWPEKVEKLIVIDIAPKTYDHSFDGLIAALKALPLATIENRKHAEIGLEQAITTMEYRQFLLQNLVLQDGRYRWRIDLDIFLQNAANIVSFPETNNLPPYWGETLFIGGKNSPYIAKTDIVNLFPAALLEIIDKAGHWLHVQQPQILLERLENFLQRG